MTDILVRLREAQADTKRDMRRTDLRTKDVLLLSDLADVFGECADEIERLRMMVTSDSVDVAEIERLRKENQRLLDDCNAWAQEVKSEQRLSFRSQAAQLEEQLAACQKDAEHWRQIVEKRNG